MRRRRLFEAFLLALSFFLPTAACAQSESPPDPIKWSLKANPTQPGKPGNLFVLELSAQIESGWHLYSTERVEGGPSPTKIMLVPGQSFEIVGEIDSPAPHSAYDPNFQVATDFYDTSVTFAIPVKMLTATTALSKIRIQVRYQSCTATLCLPPKLIDLETSLAGDETKSVPTAPAGESTGAISRLAPGAIVPDFEFTDFSGKARRFSEFRGRVVLLDFWASWCSPCLADIPYLKTAYQKYRAQGFEIVGMDTETLGQQEIEPDFLKESQIKAREIVSSRGITWTQSVSESSLPVAEKFFAIENLPAKILVDRDGRFVARIVKLSELDSLVVSLLNSNPQNPKQR